jgi:hypothetical protein
MFNKRVGVFYHNFKNSLIIHEENTKKIISVSYLYVMFNKRVGVFYVVFNKREVVFYQSTKGRGRSPRPFVL